jgi:hypothetical protein
VGRPKHLTEIEGGKEEIMAVDVVVSIESVAVFLDVSGGERLTYRVTVRGATPIFTLVDSQTKKLLMSNNDSPSQTTPAVIYERNWPLPEDQKLEVTSHTMGFQFLAAISYKYEVLRQRADGTSEVIMDITYSSTSPTDSFFQDLQVTTV